VDTLRDLARVEPRRQSRLGPPHDEAPARQAPSYWLLCWQAAARHWLMLVAGAAGMLTLTLLAATRPSVSDASDVRAAAKAIHAPVSRSAMGPRRAGAAPTQPCQPADVSTGYVNPLAGAAVTPRRIDQGVDYAGSGTLVAIGDATITHLATSETGWPGAFIEYQLLSGPESGCYVFYAESVTPAEGLYVGETVRAGQAIATIIPDYSTGIEIGWGAGEGTRTYAAKMGQWSARAEEENIPTAAGMSFSSLIASLRGPPGRMEGQPDQP
jgi:hypothetical protein